MIQDYAYVLLKTLYQILLQSVLKPKLLLLVQ
nr:MAG TPA: hypothetical protein [Caudoviricetes sp.]